MPFSPLGATPHRHTSGVKVFYNATSPPKSPNSCIEWVDGSRTDGNGGCAAMDRWADW